MLSSNQHVISTVTQWLRNGEMAWLCTILKTWGSSPRPTGSLMACNLAGELAGSISGGCIEEDLLQQLNNGSLLQRHNEEKRPFIIKYGITEDEVERFKLPCGGQLHILLELIEPTAENLANFNRLNKAINQHQPIARQLNLETGGISVLAGSPNEACTDINKNLFTHQLSPSYKLLLIGAGEVARYVAQMALALDYEITLCDPREHYLNNWQVNGVIKTNKMPDDVVRKDFSHNYAAIVALAHDPRVDDMALMEALKTDAFYVGAMGSIKTSEKRRERLPQLDLTPEEINKLHAPIGFSIGSKTPAEIAISILAELTAVRSKVNSATTNHIEGSSLQGTPPLELEISPLKIVSQSKHSSRAIW